MHEVDEIWREACGEEDAGRIENAISLYRKAARMGHVDSQNNLAVILDDAAFPGRSKEAMYRYKKAHKNGSHLAAYNLAMHYRNLGKRRWYIYWLGKSAQSGNEDAVNKFRKEIQIVR